MTTPAAIPTTGTGPILRRALSARCGLPEDVRALLSRHEVLCGRTVVVSARVLPAS